MNHKILSNINTEVDYFFWVSLRGQTCGVSCAKPRARGTKVAEPGDRWSAALGLLGPGQGRSHGNRCGIVDGGERRLAVGVRVHGSCHPDRGLLLTLKYVTSVTVEYFPVVQVVLFLGLK